MTVAMVAGRGGQRGWLPKRPEDRTAWEMTEGMGAGAAAEARGRGGERWIGARGRGDWGF